MHSQECPRIHSWDELAFCIFFPIFASRSMTARTKPLSPKFIEKLVLGCSENIRSEHKTRSENKTLKGGGARLLDLETQMEIFEPVGDEAEGPPCDGCKSGPQESHEVVGGCQKVGSSGNRIQCVTLCGSPTGHNPSAKRASHCPFVRIKPFIHPGPGLR